MIISGQVDRPQEKYKQAATVAQTLERASVLGKDGIDPEGDYEVDENNAVALLQMKVSLKLKRFLLYRTCLIHKIPGPITSPMH